MTTEAKSKIIRQGTYLDIGGLWVRYDCIGTIKQIDAADPDGNPQPYCQVVLTIPGYKTLGVGCTADELIEAIRGAERNNEVMVGMQRAKGMRA
jgi:hypothetical protein